MSKRSFAGISPCTLASVAVVALLAAHQIGTNLSSCLDERAGEASRSFAAEVQQLSQETRAAEASGPVAEDSLAGLWNRYEGRSEGDPVRFWYFHGNGKGLYRYGRVGYSNTHSFDYDLEGETLRLRFRKTGEEHELVVHFHEDGRSRSLSLDGDPRESGAHYRLDAGTVGEGAESQAASRFSIDDRVWVDMRRFATGGAGFGMYQLQPATIDGRGVGWFHEGDFDEWRTEALTYRINGDSLELFFDLNEELGMTRFDVLETGGEPRKLRLGEDPRDFWLANEYADAGKSFAAAGVDPVGIQRLRAN